MKRSPLWWRGFIAAISPRRQLKVVESDTLPEKLPRRDLMLAREGSDQWAVGMRCPCGCGQRIELMLLREVKPRWDIILDPRGRPSLTPSVWLRTGCRSHFWLRSGKIVWCD